MMLNEIPFRISDEKNWHDDHSVSKKSWTNKKYSIEFSVYMNRISFYGFQIGEHFLSPSKSISSLSFEKRVT